MENEFNEAIDKEINKIKEKLKEKHGINVEIGQLMPYGIHYNFSMSEKNIKERITIYCKKDKKTFTFNPKINELPQNEMEQIIYEEFLKRDEISSEKQSEICTANLKKEKEDETEQYYKIFKEYEHDNLNCEEFADKRIELIKVNKNNFSNLEKIYIELKNNM